MAYYKSSFEKVWEDDSLCVVCSADMGKSPRLVCSATCEDISLWRESQSYSLDNEEDCYA